MSTVRVNVGGTTFETTEATLLRCPYFQARKRVEGHSDSLFIDQDPKAFRHVLNWLRNPEYDFPAKYLSVLHFYGISVHDLREEDRYAQQQLVEQRLPSDIIRFQPALLCRRPQLTFHRKRCFRASAGCMMFECYNCVHAVHAVSLEGQTAKSVHAVYLLLPKSFTDLENARVSLTYTYDSDYPNEDNANTFTKSYHLDVYRCFQMTGTIEGYCVYQLLFGEVLLQPIFVGIGEGLGQLHLQLTLPRPTVSLFRVHSSPVSQFELDRHKLVSYQTVRQDIKEATFQSSVQLDTGYLRFLCWCTSEPATSAALCRNGVQVYTLSPIEFRYISQLAVYGSNLRHSPPKLPKDCGAIYFCQDPFNMAVMTGGLSVTDTDVYSLTFEPEGLAGRLWQFHAVCTYAKSERKCPLVMDEASDRSQVDGFADI